MDAVLLCVMLWAVPGVTSDSLRMETENGKTFVIHQVDARETLYGISKRYNSPIAGILEFNPMADAGLDVGQILKIPYVSKSKTATAQGVTVHRVAAKETLYSISKQYNVTVDDIKVWNNLKDNSLSQGQELIIKAAPAGKTTDVSTIQQQSLKGVHTVTSGETLFGISRQFGVSVDDLKKWNGLTSGELTVGQVLFVTQPMNTPVETKTITKTSGTDNSSIVISEGIPGSDEMKEAGLAELIEGTEGNRKYLALHRTAKQARS
ncbi:MAG: LysM peptidoglycan-binding domain-containing protein [Flammeovirgaceae bacterium]|nr:LysM peptidoglycan-binding domain-containing protein [Flammeovirgaceae bacterium]